MSADGDSTAVVTDEIGGFRLMTMTGSRRLHVRAIGYLPLDTLIVVTETRMSVGAEVTRAPTQLDSVRVTATGTRIPLRYGGTSRFDTFYEHRRTAIGGSFFTRDELETAGSSDVFTMLRKIPGVHIERGPSGSTVVRFERCVRGIGRGNSGSAVVQVFVDGVKVGSPFTTLETFHAADIEAMEVYQGTAQLPAEARGDGCAAIFIWSGYTPGAVDSNPI